MNIFKKKKLEPIILLPISPYCRECCTHDIGYRKVDSPHGPNYPHPDDEFVARVSICCRCPREWTGYTTLMTAQKEGELIQE